jgi:pre-mRNA-processing factor 17
MSALVAGYDSSDEEATARPTASTSTLRAVSSGLNAAADDDEDDDAIEEQARTDAFGLAGNVQKMEERKSAKTEVVAAPDVLKEVGAVVGFLADK